MTTVLAAPAAPPTAPVPGSHRGGRRAIRRWAWRLLRREWRQHLLILALLVLAVAATTVGLGVIVNVSSSDQAQMGTATTRLDVLTPHGDAASVIAAAKRAFGAVEVIEHEAVPVPGSVTSVDVRAQAREGLFSTPMLRLVAGHWPSGSDQVALTAAVASSVDLRVGSDWAVNGRTLRVVGMVENPRDLQDGFALVAPGHVPSPSSLTLLTGASGQAAANFRARGGRVVNILSNGKSAAARRQAQALGVLLLATIGLSFVGLLSVAGFTVMAHRRMRALGMIAAIGATDRQVRRVMLANGTAVGTLGAGAGVVLGLVVWFALRPSFETVVGHRIDPFGIPWWAVLASVPMAVLTALAASWWPARSVARMPIVAALSGRPLPPRPAHRFALVGVVLGAGGFVLLVLAHGMHTVPVVTGIVATTGGMLLLAPLGIRVLATIAPRTSISVRLALRDLARHQARSGAALAAAGLAVGIAATIAVTAAAQQAADHSLSGGNLPVNQMIVWLHDPNDNGLPTLSDPAVSGQGGAAVTNPAVLAGAHRTAAAIAQTLSARTVELELPVDPTPVPGTQPLDHQASLGYPETGQGHDGFRAVVTTPFLATPAILRLYRISAGDIAAGTEVLTARTDLVGARILVLSRNLGSGRPVRIQTTSLLPRYTSAPTTLITQRGAAADKLTGQPAGWLLQTTHPLTSAQIADARRRAAEAGITIEARTAPSDSIQQVREYSTVAGALVALAVLAMTVGLIRSEAASDLRTLAAAGASSRTRRTLTAATAAALALLGGVLGTAGAYLALFAWHWHQLSYLDHPPYLDLAALLVGLPALAFAGGWLLDRTPTSIARSPME